MTMPFRLCAVAVLMLGVLGSAVAETTTDRYGKELKIEPSRNLFARFGVLGFKINNKSEAARDVSGPVLSAPATTAHPTAGDRGWYCSRIVFDPNTGDQLTPCDSTHFESSPKTIYGGDLASNTSLIHLVFHDVGSTTLGLPEDVRARVTDPAPGAVGTVGMYFDEDHKWAIEVPVMALPFSLDVYGAGTFEKAGKIITGKALGFMAFGHYYFGQKADKFRPSVSMAVNYLVPYDLHSTPEFERWTGGVTKVSSKGSIGLGWLVGGKYAINEQWDLNFNIGQFRSKVENTLITYDTKFSDKSPIFTYWPGQLGENLRSIIPGNTLQNQLAEIMVYRNSDPANRVNGGANLGTFIRKQTQHIDPYVLLMTVGYNF
jgi:outer membrane protein W